MSTSPSPTPPSPSVPAPPPPPSGTIAAAAPPSSPPSSSSPPPPPLTPGRALLRTWLNKNMRVVLSDGRVLVGIFLCTDKDSNVILGSCTEMLPEDEAAAGASEPRMLGLAMVPGKHISSIKIDEEVTPPPVHIPQHQLA